MAKQFVVTEEEFMSLIEQLKIAEFERTEKGLTAEESNRLANVHRGFHYRVVRWVQAMGCTGFRH